MVLKKKGIYLGVTLFSSMILATLTTNQTVKADTTSDTSTTSTLSSAGSTSSTTSTGTTASTTSSMTTSSTGTTTPTTSSTTSTGTTTPTTSSTTATSTGTTAPTTSSTTTTSTGTTAPTTSSMTTSSTGTTAPTTSSTTTTSTGTTAPTTGSTTTTSTGTAAPTTGSTTTTSTGTTTPTTSSTTATSTGTTAPTTSSTTTSSTGTTAPTTSSTTTSTTGTITIGGTTTSPTTTTNPTSTGSTTINATSPTGTVSYTIPSDVSDSTVVNFTDPLLSNVVKRAFNIPATTPLTVGVIKSFKNPLINISVTAYQLNQKNQPGASMSDQDSTPIESLNGMQYMQLLPATTQVIFQAKLASDPNSDPNLTPLQNVNFSSLTILGNYSDPKAKQIDVSQLTKINVSKANYVDLTADKSVSSYSGINDAQLKELAPWLTGFIDNGTSGGVLLELGSAAVSDFSPLKNIDPNANATIISLDDGNFDPTPVYGIIGQPLTFKARPFLGIQGEDLSSTYHFTGTVAKSALADGNLENLGDGNYKIQTPDTSQNVLTYGHIGFMYSTNPDAYIMKKYDTNTFEYFGIHGQPLIWQTNPTVTINYMNADGTPLTVNGSTSKQIAGANVNDKFDLTADSVVPGYTLSTPVSALTGAYTVTPQVINLVYNRAVSSSSGSTSGTPTPEIPATPITREEVNIYQVGQTTAADRALARIGVNATTTIGGQLYYQVGYGSWIEADDYNAVVTTQQGVVRSFGGQELVDSQGNGLGFSLLPNTSWKYSKVVSINGKGYYQVATDEYLPLESGVDFTPVSATTHVDVSSEVPLYNSQGERLSNTLSSGSSWVTDGSAIINGVKMYRVATDEWVPADSIQTYEPVSTLYQATSTTTVYDGQGNALTKTLPAGTTWRVDRIFVNSAGERFYRVATNEYVRA